MRSMWSKVLVGAMVLAMGVGVALATRFRGATSSTFPPWEVDDEAIRRLDAVEDDDDDADDDGDGDDTRGDDGTNGGNNTGDGDNTTGNDGTNGGNNTGDGDDTLATTEPAVATTPATVTTPSATTEPAVATTPATVISRPGMTGPAVATTPAVATAPAATSPAATTPRRHDRRDRRGRPSGAAFFVALVSAGAFGVDSPGRSVRCFPEVPVRADSDANAASERSSSPIRDINPTTRTAWLTVALIAANAPRWCSTRTRPCPT